MSTIKWDFPLLGTGNEQGYSNAGIETFKGTELIDNLAREICQNSLDVKISPDLPVIVSFNLEEFLVDEYPALSALRESVVGCKRFWGNRAKKVKENSFIKAMDDAFAAGTIKVLVASDYNTVGLTGMYAGHDDDSKWRSLTSSDGSTDKDDSTSGGNFGIGKNAPFACSVFSTVFYNTRAKDNGVGFQGTARWISMIDDSGKKTQGIGHYLNYCDESNFGPILPEHEDKFAQHFLRAEDQLGTDVIILGFSGENEDWKTSITRAVLKNFFVAIVENKLIVKVGDTEISKDTIGSIIEKFKDDKGLIRAKTRQLYQAYIDPSETYHFSILEPNDVTFKIKIDETFSKVYANFRNNGMLIDQYAKRSIPVFAAVLVVNDIGEKKLSSLLRDTEPPRHNVWDYKRIKDDTKENKARRKLAKDSLEKIQDEIVRILNIYSAVEVTEHLDGGIGEFLSADNQNGNEKGSDELRVVQKIRSIKDKHGRRSMATEQGDSAVGKPTKQSGVKVGPPKPPHPIHPKRIIQVDPSEGTTPGVARGDGKLLVSATDIISERTLPVSAQHGIYKTMLEVSRDYNNVYFKVSAARDDRKEEGLLPVSFTQDKKKYPVTDEYFGPISLKSGQVNNIFIEFAEKERMGVTVLVLEEIVHEKK